tara:strand:+ start:14476 stop:15963 length:1488 start_codon:yes stop_codon:yes gene_type:complete
MNLEIEHNKYIYKKDHLNNGLNKYLKSVLNKFSSSILFCDDEGNYFYYGDIKNIFSTKTKSLIKRRLIFCFCDNEISSLAGYLYFLSEEAIPMMIKLDTSKDQVSNLLEKYSPKYIWVNKNSNSIFKDYFEIDGFGKYILIEKKSIDFKIHSSLSLLIGTSGSTGNTKFVRLSYKNIISNAIAIADYLKITNSEIPITTLKPSYTFGLSILHSHVIKGARIAVTKKTFFDKSFWEFLKSSNSTSISGVPYHYQIMQKLRFHKMNFENLKTMTQAGGRINIDTAIYFRDLCKKKNIDFYIMYGQSEGTARLSYLSPKNLSNKIGSIGQAIPGGEFWIENNNKKVDINVNGELIYSGPNVSMGYAKNYTDLIKNDENKFVLKTGDIAYKDSDSFYYVVGRLTRFVKLFGHRVNLFDLEIWFEKKNIKIICSGKDDLLELYFEAKNIHLFESCYQKFLKEFKIPIHIINAYSIDSFPLGESGKILFKDLNPSLGKKIK